MMLFRLSTVLAIGGAVAAGALLFWTSQHVQQSENRLANLKQAVQSEEQSIRVLRAEWDYLNRPDRLEALAAEHLQITAPEAQLNMVEDAAALPDHVAPVIPGHKPQQVNYVTKGGGQ